MTFKKALILGYSSGIGNEIFNYFQSKNIECIGLSRRTGHNISLPAERLKILQQAEDCDIFVNAAYDFRSAENYQLKMLELICGKWRGQDKVIVNISSRGADYSNILADKEIYSTNKQAQDRYCTMFSTLNSHPFLINLRPSVTDVPRTVEMNYPKLTTKNIVTVLNFILENKDTFRVSSITFNKV
jgi:hypothetical protein